jgi:parallel beta-helix repeat protein
MQSPVSLDLAGNPRVFGAAVDIGCYEYTGTTPPAPVVEPPILGAVTVTPGVTNATVSGTITSVGNNGATACDVYFALDSGAATKIVEGATASFEYVISNLTAETTYSWTLSVSNNAETVLGAETSGSFTTEAGSVEPGPEPEPGDAILPGENSAATRQAIQNAIDAAVPTHGTVMLGNGLFEIDAQLNITGGVTLIGQGWAKTVIKQTATSGWDEASAKRCAVVKDGSRVEGMALTGGNAAVSGAGILVEDGVISWCCITNNTVKQYTQMGGGVCFKSGQGTIDHSIVANNTINTASSYGGGIAVTATTGPVLIDTCLVYGNSCSLNCGGGIAIKSADHDCTVRNCTVANNRAGSNSAGIFRETGSGNLVLIDTIAVLNMNNNGEANIQTSWMPLDAANSKNCFFGVEAEAGKVVGSLFGDPKFVDAANGDYHLCSDSPAKGAGASYLGIGKDLDGKDFASSPSIGCYEISSGKKSGVIIFVR